MIKKSHWHQNLLTATAISIGLVTVYSFIDSDVGNRPVSKFTFPEKIPLSSGKNIANETIEIAQSTESNDVVHSANRYYYQEENTELDVAMYYLTDTRGDINSLLLKQTQISPKALENQQIKQQGNNYYSVFSDRDRTYLSTCLHPTGESTVTQKQFSQSLNQRPLNLKLLKDWLLGKASIRDRRCLWIVISTPHNNLSFLEPEDILQEAWQQWDRWWQPRFPTL